MDNMTLDQFREAKNSGVDLYDQGDAAPEIEEQEIDEPVIDEQEQQEEIEEVEDADTEQEEDPEPIPKEQQNAFYKRMQRERKKAYEEAEAKVKADLEAQFNPYKQFFESLGTTPEQAMQMVEQNKLNQEAQKLAYQNGWDEEQTQWYVQQEQQRKEMHDLRVAVQVNEMADSPDYPGIKQMKGQISDFVKMNPNMTVHQAYWAVGGQSLAQQLKRETEQREIVKRQQTKRTVVSDSVSTTKEAAPLSAEDVAFMRENRMSEQEVRMLKTADFKDIEGFRKWKKTQRR